MEEKIESKYHIGQYVEAYIEAEWLASVVTSIQSTDPVQYGIISIRKNKSFFLTADSLRCQAERVLVLADDSLEDSYCEEGLEMSEQVNFSLVSSDDETLFITPAYVVERSPSHSSLEDSYFDFAKETEEMTLASPTRVDNAVNGWQPEESPSADSHIPVAVSGENVGFEEGISVEDSHNDPDIEVDVELFHQLLDTEFEEAEGAVGGVNPVSPVPAPRKPTSV